MTEEFKKEFERQHLALKKRNENRAKAEAAGLAKFYQLKRLFDAEKQKNKQP